MRSRIRRAAGFTMVEIVVTFTVLAVLTLAGVAGYQTFIARSAAATDGVALRRLVLVEQGLARDYGAYSAWPADLTGVGSDITVTGATSSGPAVLSVAVGDGGSLGAAVRTSAGECLLRLVGPLEQGAATSSPTLPVDRPCAGSEALALAAPPQNTLTASSVKP